MSERVRDAIGTAVGMTLLGLFAWVMQNYLWWCAIAPLLGKTCG